MSLSSQVAAFASRVAQEIKAVRVELSAAKWTYVIATQDTPSTIVTAATATGLSLIGLSPGLYRVEGIISTSSVTTTTGVKVGITNNSSGTAVATIYALGANGATTTPTFAFIGNNQLPLLTSPTTASTSAGNFVGLAINGVIRVTGIMTGSIDITVASEIAGSEVRIKADSFLALFKIA